MMGETFKNKSPSIWVKTITPPKGENFHHQSASSEKIPQK